MAASAYNYTIYKEHIDEDLTWFPVTLSLTSTTPSGFFDTPTSFTETFNYPDGFGPTEMSLWRKWNAGGSISSHKFYCNAQAGATFRRGATLNYELSGDFDVQVDFNVVSSIDSNGWHQAISANIGSQRLDMGRGYREGQNRYLTWRNDLVWGAYTSTSDTSGKFRLVRTGANLYAYYDSSGWQLLDTYTSFGTGDVTINIQLSIFTNTPTTETTFDNFVVNSGTLIPTYPERQVYVENANGDKIYTEVEHFDFANSLATLHTAVPTVSADADTTLTLNWDWEGERDFTTRAYPSASYADSFPGTVDGTEANSNRWTVTQTSIVPTIVNNKLHMEAPLGSSHSQYVDSKFKLQGDFDIQINWENLVWNGTTSGNAPEFRIYSAVDNHRVAIRRLYDGGHVCKTQSWDGSTHTLATTSMTATDGRFRIVRSGSTVTTYYWSSGAWVSHATDSYNAVGTDDVYVRIITQNWSGNPGIDVDIDNFKVNSAGSIDWGDYEDVGAWVETFDGLEEKWQYIGAKTGIENGKLNMPLGSGESNADTQAYWVNDNFPGNVDVQVDFELITWPNSSFWSAQLVVADTDGEGCSLVRGYYGTQRYYVWENNSGWQANTSTSDVTGKLRVTRVGTTWTCYKWNGSSWDTLHSWDPGTAAPITTVYLTMRHGNTNPGCEVNWDNFQFNNSMYDFDNDVNDDFTGTNGDPPDVLKWTEVDPDDAMNIQSNKLSFDGLGSGNKISSAWSKHQLSGDFDVQVDWTIDTWTRPNTSDSYLGWLELRYGSTYVYLARQGSSADNRVRLFGTGGTNEVWSWTGTSGKMRFVQSGSTLTAYVWTGSQWEWNGNTAGIACSEDFSGGAGIRLYAEQETGHTIAGTFDNFQVNSADSVTGWTDTTANRASQLVWDSNYKIVVHLADTPTGSADDILDSTGNEYHGTSHNMDSSNSGTNNFGKYLYFNGSNEYICHGDAFWSNDVTLEVVPQVSSFSASNPRMLWSKRNVAGTATTDSANSEWACQFQSGTNMNFQVWRQPQADIIASDGISTGFDMTGSEIYHAATITSTGSGSCYAYVNGEHDLGALRENYDIHNGALGIQLGTRSNNNDNRWFHGNIREGRISDIQRSHSWIKATNLSLMGGLFDEPVIAAPSGSKVYTIDKDYIDEDLTWFPATLSTSSTGSPAPSADFWQYFNNEGKDFVDDTFTGTNGDPPDSVKWRVVNQADSSVEIQSNELRTTANGSPGNGEARSLFKLTGDFDIEIDWSADNHPTTNSWGADFIVWDGTGTVGIRRSYQSSDHYYQSFNTAGQIQATGTSDTSGKLRVRRSGSTITLYYHDGTDWNDFGTDTTTIGTNAVYVRIKQAHWSGYPTSSTDWDNFHLGYAGGVEWEVGDRVYFEDADSNRLYTEIETFDTATSAAVYHFAVPTVSAGADTPITMNWNWEDRSYDTRTTSEAGDTFTGNDGDPPDVMKFIEDGGTSYFQIQTNKLYATGSSVNKWLRPRYRLTGDFSVQTDWEALQAPSTNEWRIGFWVTQEGGDGNTDYFSLYRGYSDDTHRIVSQYKDGGSWTGTQIFATAVTSGKFRIRRTTTTIYTDYDVGGGWVNLNSHDFGEAPSIQVIFEIVSGTNNPTAENTWDNFVVNSADSITGWTDETGNLPSQTVWDDNYQIVCHMHSTPTGSADDILDSTDNEYHGTSYNMGSTNSDSNDLGSYLTFDGTEEFIDFGDAFYSNEGSIEAIVNVTNYSNNDTRNIVVKRNTAGTTTPLTDEIIFRSLTSHTPYIGAWNAAAGLTVSKAGIAGDDSTGIEVYVAGAYDSGGGSDISAQQNDVINTGADRGATAINDTSSAWQIAARDSNDNDKWFLGDIREVRISDIYRSEAWRKATYYSLMGEIWVPFEPSGITTLTVQDLTSLTSTDNIILQLFSWILSMQDINVTTSIDANMWLIVWLIIQNLDVSTSMSKQDLIHLVTLIINSLTVETNLSRMQFWRALKTINNTVEFRTLMRTLVSKSLDRTLDSKTVERTIKQIKQLGHFYDNP